MISSQYTPDIYLADGIQTVHTFTFPIKAKADLRYFVRNLTTGAITQLALDSDYTIDDSFVNNAAGGQVVRVTATPAGSQIVLKRRTQRTQLVNLGEGNRFPAAAMMAALDRLTMVQHELENEGFMPTVVAVNISPGDIGATITHGLNTLAANIVGVSASWQTTVTNNQSLQTVNTMKLDFSSPVPSGGGTLTVTVYAAGAGTFGVPPSGFPPSSNLFTPMLPTDIAFMLGQHRFRYLNSGASIYIVGNQTIGPSTSTLVLLNTVEFDTDGLRSAANPERLTIQLTGKYIVSASLHWASVVGGNRYLILQKNGAGNLADLIFPIPSGFTLIQNSMTILNLVAGDYLQVRAFQDTAGDVDVLNLLSKLMCMYIGE